MFHVKFVSRTRLLTFSLLLHVLLLLIVTHPTLAANTTLSCKCSCPPNITVFSLEIGGECVECTKKLCVDRGLCFLPISSSPDNGTFSNSSSSSSVLSASPAAAETAKSVIVAVWSVENMTSWTTVCFQRGSSKDEFIVYSFILVVSLLINYVVFQKYIERYIPQLVRKGCWRGRGGLVARRTVDIDILFRSLKNISDTSICWMRSDWYLFSRVCLGLWFPNLDCAICGTTCQNILLFMIHNTFHHFGVSRERLYHGSLDQR